MKLLLKIFLALTVVSIVSNVVPSPFASWAQDTAYENCTDLRADWPSGVARNEKAAQKISAAGTAKPRVQAGTYGLNERLETDNNGVVCEDKKTGAQLLGEVIVVQASVIASVDDSPALRGIPSLRQQAGGHTRVNTLLNCCSSGHNRRSLPPTKLHIL